MQTPPILQDLRLSHNQIETLPCEIGQMTALRQLKCPFNLLKTVPPELGNLENLIELTLQNNLLETLPMDLGKLSRLDALLVDHNPNLLSPPRAVYEKGTLYCVKYMRRCFDARVIGVLDVSAYGLTTVPKEITDLTNLTYLKLDKNRLMSFPPEIGQLVSLTELSASGNKLVMLPPELGLLENLQQLRIDYEDLRTPPEEVLNGGTTAIMSYLKHINSSKLKNSVRAACLHVCCAPSYICILWLGTCF